MKINRRSVRISAIVGALALAVGIGAPVIASSDSAAGSKVGSTSSLYSLNESNISGGDVGINVWQAIGNGVTPDKWSGHYAGSNDQKTWTAIGSDGQKGKTLTKGDDSRDYEAVAYLSSIAKNYAEKKDYSHLDLISVAIQKIAGVKLSEADAQTYKDNYEAVDRIIVIAHDQAGPYKASYDIEGAAMMRSYIYTLKDFNVVTGSGSEFSSVGIDSVFEQADENKDATTNGKIIVDSGATTPSEDDQKLEAPLTADSFDNFTFKSYDIVDTCSANAAGITVTFKDIPSSTIVTSDALGDDETDASTIASLLRYGETDSKVMNLSPCGNKDESSISAISYVGSGTSRWRDVTEENVDSLTDLYSEVTLYGLKEGAKYTLGVQVQNSSTFLDVASKEKSFTFDRVNNAYDISVPIADFLKSNRDGLVAFPYVKDEQGNVVLQLVDYEDENLFIQRDTKITDINVTASVEGKDTITIMGSSSSGKEWNESIDAKLTIGGGLDDNNVYYAQFKVLDKDGLIVTWSNPQEFEYSTANGGTFSTSFGVENVQQFEDGGFYVIAEVTDSSGEVVASFTDKTAHIGVEFAYEEPDPGPSFDPATVRGDVASAYSDSLEKMMSADGVSTKKIIDAYEASPKSDSDKDALVAGLSGLIPLNGVNFPDDKVGAIIDIAQGAWFGNARETSVNVPSDAVTIDETGTSATIDTSKIVTSFNEKNESVFDAGSVSLTKDGSEWKVVAGTSDFKAGPTPTEPKSDPDPEPSDDSNAGSPSQEPQTVDDTDRSNNNGSSTDKNSTNKNNVGTTDINTNDRTVIDGDDTGDVVSANRFGIDSLRKTGAPIAGAALAGIALVGGGLLLTKKRGFHRHNH